MQWSHVDVPSLSLFPLLHFLWKINKFSHVLLFKVLRWHEAWFLKLWSISMHGVMTNSEGDNSVFKNCLKYSCIYM